MLLEHKNAVVYGAGGSIGGAVSRAFAREGARVFLAGRTRATLERVAGRRVEGRCLDAARGDGTRTKADVLRIGPELGRTPRTSLEAGLAAMWSWSSGTVAAA